MLRRIQQTCRELEWIAVEATFRTIKVEPRRPDF